MNIMVDWIKASVTYLHWFHWSSSKDQFIELYLVIVTFMFRHINGLNNFLIDRLIVRFQIYPVWMKTTRIPCLTEPGYHSVSSVRGKDACASVWRIRSNFFRIWPWKIESGSSFDRFEFLIIANTFLCPFRTCSSDT